MVDKHVAEDIKQANLMYLLIAQRLLRDDCTTAPFRLGIGAEACRMLLEMSLTQILKLASSNTLLCKLRFDDRQILETLMDCKCDKALAQSHAVIMMSSHSRRRRVS